MGKSPTEGKSMGTARKSVAFTGALLSLGLMVAASGCSSSTTSSSTATSSKASTAVPQINAADFKSDFALMKQLTGLAAQGKGCLLYTSDAADDLTRVDLGVRRII